MKRSLFENSARVPLIIVAPAAKGRGKPCPRTVEFVDLYPTLAEMTGLSAPKNLAGKSLSPLLNDPAAKWDKPAFTQVWRGTFSGHSVRTEQFRYTEWDNGNEGLELYDYTKDPEEKRNLAKDTAYSTKLSELQSLLRRNWPTEYRPPAEEKKKTGKKKKGATE
jgi:uncharacterized sulfatase